MLADVNYLNVGVNGGGTVPVPFAPGSNIDGGVNASVKTQGWILDLIGRSNYWQSPKARIELLARPAIQGCRSTSGWGSPPDFSGLLGGDGRAEPQLVALAIEKAANVKVTIGLHFVGNFNSPRSQCGLGGMGLLSRQRDPGIG